MILCPQLMPRQDASKGEQDLAGSLTRAWRMSTSDIDAVRKVLQSAGLIFFVKNSDGVPCDIIPEEIALCLR